MPLLDGALVADSCSCLAASRADALAALVLRDGDDGIGRAPPLPRVADDEALAAALESALGKDGATKPPSRSSCWILSDDDEISARDRLAGS